MNLYGRIASLNIGQEGQQGVHISEVRIAFRISKTATRTVNSAHIEIYNLSKSTREKIASTDNIVILNAGYSEAVGEEVIFRGDIDRFVHTIAAPDRIFNIEAGDGSRVLRQTRVALSFIGGITAQEIFNEIVNQLPGIDSGYYAVTQDKEFANGWSFVGLASDALDKIALSLNAAWSIQNNAIQIVDIKGNNQTEATHLSPSSGLIDCPEKLDELGDQLVDEKRPQGWRIQTLLMPKIEPRGIISLESEEANGYFTVDSIEHTGDTHGRPWNSIMEVFEEQL